MRDQRMLVSGGIRYFFISAPRTHATRWLKSNFILFGGWRARESGSSKPRGPIRPAEPTPRRPRSHASVPPCTVEFALFDRPFASLCQQGGASNATNPLCLQTSAPGRQAVHECAETATASWSEQEKRRKRKPKGGRERILVAKSALTNVAKSAMQRKQRQRQQRQRQRIQFHFYPTFCSNFSKKSLRFSLI